MLPLAQPFDAREVVPCTVSRRSLVRVEATAYVGPESVEIVCREQR